MDADLPITEKLSLTPEQVFVLTGIPARTVREYVKRGELRRVRYRARILIARVELDRFLAAPADDIAEADDRSAA